MDIFDAGTLNNLHKPDKNSSGEDNGEVTIIGGSELFHGAPLLSLKVASRLVDIVFFASPDPSIGNVAEQIKSKLLSFIWVPWDEVEDYIAKSDAVLIGPGLMRYHKEDSKHKVVNSNLDAKGRLTRNITQKLLKAFPDKKWVIDAGSLQVMDANWIPEGAIVTPNKKEFELLFRIKDKKIDINNTDRNLKIVQEQAKKYKCTIVLKGPKTIVCSPSECNLVEGGNAGMTKGGTGDVLAGLIVALLAKNDVFLAVSSASYIIKHAADELYKKVGVNFNADDLADKIPETIANLI